MDNSERVVTLRGRQYTIQGRAWWTDGALDNQGRIEVARIHAEDLVLRLPSREQCAKNPALNPYWADASNEGSLQSYMLGLTEENLAELGLTPGIITGIDVVDGPRPATNRVDRPVSLRQARQAMDWLQNDCLGKPSDY